MKTLIDLDKLSEADRAAVMASNKPRKPNLYNPPEREVQKSGIAILKAMGWQVWRRNVGAVAAVYNGKKRFIRHGEPGMSDTWGITPDWRHFELEFKRRGQKPSPAQLAWLRSMNGPHHVSFWVDSTEWLEHTAHRIASGCSVIWLDGCDYITHRTDEGT